MSLEDLYQAFRQANPAYLNNDASTYVLIAFLAAAAIVLFFVSKKFRVAVDQSNEEKKWLLGTPWLLLTSLGVFLLQIFVNGYWGVNETREWSHNMGMFKTLVVNPLISFIPIGVSICLCNTYWNKMEEDIKDKKYSESIYPTLMVAQGTFFTFVGVSAILFSYNASSSNIETMISGLKLAFLTSVIGLIYSIAAKIYFKERLDEYNKKKNKNNDKKYLDESDFYSLMNTMVNSLNNIIHKLNTTNASITDSAAKITEAQDISTNKLAGILTERLENSFQANTQNFLSQSEQVSARLIEQVNSSVTQIITNMTTASSQMASRMEETAYKFSNSITSTLGKTNTEIEKIQSNLVKTNDLVLEWNNSNQKILENIETLRKEYQNVLEDIGQVNQLIVNGQISQASIVEKFNNKCDELIEKIDASHNSSINKISDEYSNLGLQIQECNSRLHNIYNKINNIAEKQIIATLEKNQEQLAQTQNEYIDANDKLQKVLNEQ